MIVDWDPRLREKIPIVIGALVEFRYGLYVV